jgi:hypothetical protein
VVGSSVGWRVVGPIEGGVAVGWSVIQLEIAIAAFGKHPDVNTAPGVGMQTVPGRIPTTVG